MFIYPVVHESGGGCSADLEFFFNSNAVVGIWLGCPPPLREKL